MWTGPIVNVLMKKANKNNDLGEIVNVLRKKSNENNVLEMGLTYSKSSGTMNSNIEKEKKNDYSDPETV